MTDNNLSDLHPNLLALVPLFLQKCEDANLKCHITVTWRDPVAQNQCKASGLSNAAAGQSPHNCVDANGKGASRAFDFALFRNGEYITDGTDAAYATAGGIAKDLRLVWGGDWNHKDWDHVELADWRSLT